MSGTYHNHPKTLDEAVDIILSELTEEDKTSIRDTKREDLIRKHYALGLYIGNSLGLWHGNQKLLASCGMQKIRRLGLKNLNGGYPFTDPYDSSCTILTAIWERLQELDEKNQNVISI